MAELVIEVQNLGRAFGKKKALDDVSLTVQRGTVQGLVGQNGAGKTTLVKHLLGLLRAQTGTVRVFGEDPVANPEKVLSRIGYLSEESDLPNWMRVDDLMRYSAAFYPTWDQIYAVELLGQFGLDSRFRLGDLSKGQRARAGLVAALAFRPELLLLDEPSSGLDPVVRRDILAAVIRTVAEEGRTVLFSSHLLTEVEQVADRVAMVRHGQVVLDDELSAIKAQHYRIDLLLPEPLTNPPGLPGAVAWSGSGKHWSALWQGEPQLMEAAAAMVGGRIVGRGGASLDDIFVAHAGAGVSGLGQFGGDR